MSEHAENTRRVRAKGWTEDDGREVLQEWHESGLSAAKFPTQRRITATRLSYCSYWEERLGQKPSGDVTFVAVPLSSQYAVEVEHRSVTVPRSAQMS